MNNEELFRFLNFILNESETGNAITLADRDMLLKATSREFFRALVKNYETTQEVTDSLERFKVHAHTVNFVAGVGAIPSDYYRNGGIIYPRVLPGGVIDKRYVDVVTDLEWNARLTQYLTRPTLLHPVIKFSGGNMYISPNTIDAVLMDYLAEPDEPAYDYYFDANGNHIYMPEGSTHTLLAGEVYRDGTPSGLMTSISVELPYIETDKLLVGSMILEKMGVNLKAGEIVEFSQMFKAQTS